MSHFPSCRLAIILLFIAILFNSPPFGDAAFGQPIMHSRMCSKMHRIKSGDSCEGTAQQYGISLEQIYTINQWNAEKCKKLEVGDFICVA